MKYATITMNAPRTSLPLGSHGVTSDRRQSGEDRTRPETEAG
jgi:hypothetical protein